MNKAVRCLSYADFLRAFGDGHPDSDLGQSVRMFFDNGGTDCYVVRLAANPHAAKLTLKALDGTTQILVVTAKSEGLWGNGLKVGVDYNTTNPDESFNFTVVQLDGGVEVAREQFTGLVMDPDSARFAPAFVTQSSALVNLALDTPLASGGAKDLHASTTSSAGYSQSRPFLTTPLGGFRTEFNGILASNPNLRISVDDGPYVDVSLASAGAALTGTWSLGDAATAVQTAINNQLSPAAAVTVTWVASPGGTLNALRITANSGKKRSVRIRRASSADFTVPALMGLDQGGIEVTRFSELRPVPNAAFFSDVTKVLALADLLASDITGITVDGGAVGPFVLPAVAPGNLWYLDSASGNDGIREKLRFIVNQVNATAGLQWRAELWGYHLAFIAKSGASNRIASAVASTTSTTLGGANFTLNTLQYMVGLGGTSSFQLTPVPTDAGDDGTAPQLSQFQGNPAQQTGFYALDPVDLFNLMVIPADIGIPEAVHSTIWGPASNYCEGRRAFLLIDAPPSWTSASGRPDVVGDLTKVFNLRATVSKEYSGVFYPRLSYVAAGGLVKLIGPAGAIAGLMARTDVQRGVWKAPAGTEADIRNIVGVEVKLTDPENGVLNKQAVNCIRAFPTGFVNWGARTMHGADDDPSDYKYIPIRRLALFLEESLFRGTKWVVFEPNDEPLWAKIRLNLNAFMMSLFREGAFQGSTPDKAFFVRCDSTTTTQNDRNLGIVNIEVGFAPLKPAEFVVIKIQQIAGDL
ncbi:MAG TPA: phage tail sheath subtilisin-like domain-containing protein [Candidatus Kapabacteria bacterium]|nr:phage tail sheath subtilisin-like domain-containing protein [Candidatus Kapabacteria bacterium]